MVTVQQGLYLPFSPIQVHERKISSFVHFSIVFMNGSLPPKIFKPHCQTLFLKLPCLHQIHSFGTLFTGNLVKPPLSSLQCGALLQSFTKWKSSQKGMELHGHLISSGIIIENTYLNTKLAAMYAICGQMGDARIIFDGIVLKNSFLWNVMIRGNACYGFSISSLHLYREMVRFGQRADNFTYPFVLKACGDLSLVEVGRKIHCEIVTCGFESDIYVRNSLLSMYTKFADMPSARTLFDRMLERDLTSWNTMISGYAKNGDPHEALLLFSQMVKVEVRADSTTFLSVLPACADLAAFKQGKEIHGYIVRNGMESNSFVINSLIDMYCNCNFVVGARQLFEDIVKGDVVSWNSLIAGYARIGDAFESIRLFHRMNSDNVAPDQVTLIAVLGACNQITALQYGRGVHAFVTKEGFAADVFVGTALINMYAKCGSLGCSRRVFDEMPEKNLVSWSAMVAGYGLHGRGMEAIAVFNKMKVKGIRPDEVAFTSVLSACSHAGLVNEGQEIFHQIKSEYSLNPIVEHYSCMVDLLGRAGHLDEAYDFINKMEVMPNVDVWAALLSASRVHHNVVLAELAARNALALNPKGVGLYVSLSNIYAAEKRWDDVEMVRAMVRQKGQKKPPGCSFVELDKSIHRFLVGDKLHPQSELIHTKLGELRRQLKEDGYIPDTSCVFYDVEDDLKEQMLWDHSERLAIAFALLNTAPGMTITITKNLRVCGDCHTVTKLISKLVSREIVVRDAHRFHHFRDGSCSCGDYW
eukprot:TRINITY_DN34793_c1_g1_i1.p1 TRINITY_DN34793_c1_g1~~TRINITY_DN34793_c1_g1_i1.p1  ORF type:complete len:754 (+),score=125.68 TRINITY_DN34793_c1_g1_i1:625-2886(+)